MKDTDGFIAADFCELAFVFDEVTEFYSTPIEFIEGDFIGELSVDLGS